MIVLDASAAIELVLATARGSQVADRIRAPEETLHAPHLIDVEVAQVLRRYVRAGTIPESRGRRALEHLSGLDLVRYPHEPFLARIWELRGNLTAYDAAYVTLAEALQAQLLTCDARLASSATSLANVETLI